MYAHTRRILNAFFRDKHGRLVLGQFPNVPLIGWLLLTVAAHGFPLGTARTGVGYLSEAFLFTWAYLEITQGVTYFRRTLGGVVLVAVLLNYFH